MQQFRGKWIVKKRIEGEIRGYIAQIIVIMIFVVTSYFIFTNSSISKYASIAAAYDTMNVDLMVSYKRDNDAVLRNVNILDKGTLSVKNPNKRNVSSILYLYVSEDANLDLVDFIVDGNVVDTTNKVIKNGYYVFVALDCEIEAFEYKYIDTQIKCNAFYTEPFSYMFNVESF